MVDALSNSCKTSVESGLGFYAMAVQLHCSCLKS